MSEAQPTISTRKLAAIFAADIADYSALVGADEEGTVRKLKIVREAAIPIIESFKGRIIDLAGDGILAEFPSAVRAVEAAIAVQRRMASLNLESAPKMRFRIGINLGDVIHDGERLYGDGINIAARLEGMASPGGICISGKIHEEVKERLSAGFRDLGNQHFKNIANPVRVFAYEGRSHRKRLKRVATGAKPIIPNKPSIAVLPFVNMSGDQEQEYFADGIVDDIITALSRIHWFFVIARTSSFVFKNRNLPLTEVSRELGVRYVLEGSVRKSANRVRITGQLVDTEAGRHIWASKFDGDLDNVFSLQDQVTASVVHAIEPSIRMAEIERARSKRTSNLTAYDLYLRSIPEAERLESAGLTRAKALLEAALVIDSHFAEAWSALADCLGRLVIGGWEEEERGFADAMVAAMRGVEADPENGSVLSVASWVHAISGKPVELALSYARRALELHPHSSFVIAHCAHALIYAGEFEAALDQLRHAKRMNPLDPLGHRTENAIGLAHFYMRQFSDAEVIERAVLDRYPTHPIALRIMAASLGEQGRIEEANQVVRELLAIFPTVSISKLSRPQMRHKWMSEMWAEALRKAGLPE